MRLLPAKLMDRRSKGEEKRRPGWVRDVGEIILGDNAPQTQWFPWMAEHSEEASRSPSRINKLLVQKSAICLDWERVKLK